MDFKTVVIHGKNAPKSRDISIANVKTKAELNRTGGLNAASLERKIDSGDVTVPQKVPKIVSDMFRDARLSMKTAEDKSYTQDMFAKHCCVPKVDVKFIQQLEGGSLLLNHDNKTTLRKLQTKLKIPHFDL
jgi:hypothetical protein